MKNQQYLFAIIILVGIIVILMSRPASIVVQDTPVKFSSVRKHPFDVFADPYHPPEKDNPYVINRNYQQVGYLQGSSGMLPLFGRPNIKNTNRWDYYTMQGGIKLPIENEGRRCQDNGCNEINSKDNLDVAGLGKYVGYLYDTKDISRF